LRDAKHPQPVALCVIAGVPSLPFVMLMMLITSAMRLSRTHPCPKARYAPNRQHITGAAAKIREIGAFGAVQVFDRLSSPRSLFSA
jgi:hypothetical protein